MSIVFISSSSTKPGVYFHWKLAIVAYFYFLIVAVVIEALNGGTETKSCQKLLFIMSPHPDYLHDLKNFLLPEPPNFHEGCAEELISRPDGDSPNPMPQLFSVDL